MHTLSRPIDRRPLAYIDPGTGLVIVTVGGWLLGLLTGTLGIFVLFAKRIMRFFRRNWKPASIVALLLAVAIAAWLYQRNRVVVGDGVGRVVVLAFDGLDPERAARLMAAERLPNLAALREQGGFRPLGTSNPAQSPVAWATFATGKNPGKHGVFDFIQRDPDTYGLVLSMSQFAEGRPQRAVRAPGFWHYADRADVPSIILALPANFPPQRLNGRVLAGMGVPDLIGTEGTFTFFTDRPSADEDVGGRVVQVRKAPEMSLTLHGPKVESDGRNVPTEVGITVELVDETSARVHIAAPEQSIDLRVGEWSDWADVEFELGLFQNARGIVRFLLQETQPGFRLYVTPVNIDPRDPFFPVSYPRDYAAHLAEHLGLYYTQGMPLDTWALNEGRLDEPAFVEQAQTVHAERYDQLFYELDRFEAGIFYAYFEDSDIIQHMFMRYEVPEHPAAPQSVTETDAYADLIDAWYERCDRVVGDVAERLRPDDVLLVISDHGFGTFQRAVHLNSWLARNDYLAFARGADSSGELFADVDWHATKAYAAGFGGIYLNLAGRERDGTVRDDPQTVAALKREIGAALRTLEDGGRPVVRRVFDGRDIYRGPLVEQAPDLVVGFHDRYRASWQTAVGAAPRRLIEDNVKKWSGDHLIDPALVPGVLFANRPIEATAPTLLDIAPSILHAVGVDDDEIAQAAFDGNSIWTATPGVP